MYSIYRLKFRILKEFIQNLKRQIETILFPYFSSINHFVSLILNDLIQGMFF